MVDLANGTDRAALEAARAEGRTEGAESIRALAARWMLELERIAEREFSDTTRDVVQRFAAALDQTLAGKIEEYRRDQSRAIAGYCTEHRAATTPPPSEASL
jgi:hypothetical protein